VFGGGIAPTLATTLYARWQSSVPVTVYLFLVSLVSLFSLVLATQRAVILSTVRAAEST
jgi:hypothetical protein